MKKHLKFCLSHLKNKLKRCNIGDDMQEIIKDEAFSKYLSEYYDELKTNIPDLINYLNIINDEIFYFIELFFLNKDEIEIDYNYENRFDKNSG